MQDADPDLSPPESGCQSLRGDLQVPHPLLHTLHRRFISRLLRLYRRGARATVALLVTAVAARLLFVLERIFAFPTLPIDFGSYGIRDALIARVPIRVFLLFGSNDGEPRDIS